MIAALIFICVVAGVSLICCAVLWAAYESERREADKWFFKFEAEERERERLLRVIAMYARPPQDAS